MKRITTFLLASLCANAMAQETLQTVTDRGNTTSNPIAVNSTTQFGSRITAYGYSQGYFDVYNNSNQSISLSLKRSDGAQVFGIDGHTMATYFGGKLGIGTTTPLTGLQLGELGNNITAKQISIPGNYNFEVLKLGQIGNGNAALEIVNHAGVDVSYGVKIKADIDNGGPGLQLQYAPTVNDYNSLQYQTGLFLSAANGDIGIGTLTPQEKLSVNGKIRAKEIKVEATGWPDYVFKPDYKLNTLPELEAYIKINGHLPGFPKAQEAEANGVELGTVSKALLKNQEELTLLLIQQNKQLEVLKNTVEEQAKKINQLIQQLEKNEKQ